MSLNQAYLELKAFRDPETFLTHPYFLGITPYPKQLEIFDSFWEGRPKDIPWSTWQTLSSAEKLKQCTPYKELVGIAGMRSGKTVLASCIACYSAFRVLVLPDPSIHWNLVPGSEIYVVCMATGEEQASDTIFGTVKGMVRRSPFFARFNPRIFDLEIRFPDKPFYMMAGTSSSSGMVGRSVITIVFDELSKFEESGGRRSVELNYTSLSKSTMTFKNEGKIVSISSPLHENDYGMQLLRKAEYVPNMYSFHCATWEMNPNLPEDGPEMAAERLKDPITFMRDFGAQPFSSYDRFYADPTILQVNETKMNLLELYAKDIPIRPESHSIYYMAGDPALKHDAFGIALGHLERGVLEVDGLYRFIPTKTREIDPVAVRKLIESVATTFGIRNIVFDTWMYPEMQSSLQSNGIIVHDHIVNAQDHESIRKRFYEKKINLCNYPFVIEECKQLRIINAKRVDHIRGGSKDVIDAVANLDWLIREVGLTYIPINVYAGY